MAKFDAGTAVEKLEYDFTAYGGSAGPITEPSTGAVNQFFKSMKGLMREVKALQASMKIDSAEDLDDEALIEQMSKMDESEADASDFQNKTVEYLAELCGATRELQIDPANPTVQIEVVVGGSPGVEELTRLPYRVLQAFSTWLMEEIKPKKRTPGTKR